MSEEFGQLNDLLEFMLKTLGLSIEQAKETEEVARDGSHAQADASAGQLLPTASPSK